MGQLCNRSVSGCDTCRQSAAQIRNVIPFFCGFSLFCHKYINKRQNQQVIFFTSLYNIQCKRFNCYGGNRFADNNS